MRTKDRINEEDVEQVSHFNFFVMWHRTLQNKVKKKQKNTFYKVMATPVLSYDSETWMGRGGVQKEESQRIQTAEMKFLKGTKGAQWDTES